MASRGSRPIRMTSYPRNRVAWERASGYRWFSRSATTWTASAPATRVTGSMLSDLMCPLRAISRWICSSRSSSVCSTGGRTVATEYGSRTPRLMRALPALSNVIGRFLKHMAYRSFVRAGGNARRSRRPPVERGELVGEAGHRAADAGPPGVHAPPVVVDGPPGGDVAVDDRAPASDLHQALAVAELAGEGPFLVVRPTDAVP